MVRNHNDVSVKRHDHKFGADGFITVKSLINDDSELNGKGRVFAHTTITPGSGIGPHVHQGDTEIYYIYSGRGIFSDNGAEIEVGPGDVTFTPSGQSHSLACIGDEPLEVIALILYD